MSTAAEMMQARGQFIASMEMHTVDGLFDWVKTS